MSLYIRLDLSFWEHRKTIRLRSIIGECALWIPPKLWSYAANNQPDGDFSDYSDEEIAMLLGYAGNPQELLKALLNSGFLDADRKVHDWIGHNGCHAFFSERAKVAAKVRWKGHKKRRNKKRIDEKRREEPSIASSIAKSNAQAMLKQAEEIYSCFPRKVAKPEALKAIVKSLSKITFESLLSKTRAFAAMRNGDLEFCPHPATWFNQERYNDDPSTWKSSNRAGQQAGKIAAPDSYSYRGPVVGPTRDLSDEQIAANKIVIDHEMKLLREKLKSP